jgi:hypothetical protein
LRWGGCMTTPLSLSFKNCYEFLISILRGSRNFAVLSFVGFFPGQTLDSSLIFVSLPSVHTRLSTSDIHLSSSLIPKLYFYFTISSIKENKIEHQVVWLALLLHIQEPSASKFTPKTVLTEGFFGFPQPHHIHARIVPWIARTVSFDILPNLLTIDHSNTRRCTTRAI